MLTGNFAAIKERAAQACWGNLLRSHDYRLTFIEQTGSDEIALAPDQRRLRVMLQ
jgi:hypothetical protein